MCTDSRKKWKILFSQLDAICPALMSISESVFPSPFSVFSPWVFYLFCPPPEPLLLYPEVPEILVILLSSWAVIILLHWRTSSSWFHLGQLAAVFQPCSNVLFQLPYSIKHSLKNKNKKSTSHFLWNVDHTDSNIWINHVLEYVSLLFTKSSRNRKRAVEAEWKSCFAICGLEFLT